MKKKYNSIPRTGLIAQYNFDGNGLDINDGTKTNLTVTNATYGTGTFGYQKQVATFISTTSATRASLASIQTICFNIIPTANTVNIFQYVTTTGLISISVGNLITTTGLVNPIVYINNIETTAIVLNQLNNVIITHDSTPATNFNFGVSSFLGKLGDTYFYNYKLSTSERQNLYQEGLRQLGAGSDNILSSAVAYYDFNGDANDVIGGNNGTVTGATLTTDRFGIANRAYSSGTSNTTSRIYNTTNLGINGGNITMSAWVKVNSNHTATNGDHPFAVGEFSGTPNWVANAIGFNTTNTQVVFSRLKTAVAWQDAIATFSPGTTTFHHYVYAYDGTTIRGYINGILSASAAASGNGGAETRSVGAFIFGSDYQTNSNQSSCTVNDFEIFKSVKTDGEILALFNTSKQKYLYPFKKTLPLNLRDGLVFWGSGDTSGTTYLDASGNGNGVVSSTPVIKRRQQHKVISLVAQSITWDSRTAGTSICWELISGKFILQLNPAYITATGIASVTKDLANIMIWNRALTPIEIQNLFYSQYNN